MKAKLTDVTLEMEQEEFVNTVKANFDALNDMADKRETLIAGRLDDMQKEIKDFKSGITKQLNGLDTKLDKILKHLGIPPDKDIIKSSEK